MNESEDSVVSQLDSAADALKCRRCGKCCYVPTKSGLVPCAMLKQRRNGRTECRIYTHRKGYVMGVMADGRLGVCGMRSDSEYDYSNCSMNTGRPILF